MFPLIRRDKKCHDRSYWLCFSIEIERFRISELVNQNLDFWRESYQHIYSQRHTNEPQLL